MIQSTQQKIIVFIHVPKCGGGSFREILTNIYGKNKIIKDIQINYANSIFDEQRKKVKITKECKALVGHFPHDKYNITEAEYVTWVRHPVSRLISHYYYIKQFPKKYKNMVGIQKDNRYVFEMDEVSFAEKMKGFLVHFVGKDLEKYSFIGRQEYFEEDINRFLKQYSIKYDNNYPHKNSSNYDIKNLDKSKVEKITEILKEDIDFYNYILESINNKKGEIF